MASHENTLVAQATQAHNAQEAVALMSVGQVVATVEAAQVDAGQMELIEMARKAPYAEGTIFAKASPISGGSSGVPTLGDAPLAVKSRPKLEVLSEPCESCSA